MSQPTPPENSTGTKTLADFVIEHVIRGACTCGKCDDAPLDPENQQPDGHTVDLGFFKCALRGQPDKREFVRLVTEQKSDYGDCDPFDGLIHDIIQTGAWIGDQALGMMCMGLGHLLGVWRVRVLAGQPLMQAKIKRLFAGSRQDAGPCVQVVVMPDKAAAPLDPKPSQAVYNHSPDGFEWGYGGSGPAQLALAILLECGFSAEVATALHQDFKRDVVAGFPNDGWLLPQSKITQWLIINGHPLPTSA